MQPLKDKLFSITKEFKQDSKRIDLKSLILERDALRNEIEDKDFWQNPDKAKSVMQQLSLLEKRISPWEKMESELADLNHLLELNDATLESDLNYQIESLQKDLTEIKSLLKYSGPHDHKDVIVSIYAGAGGTDAQDWTQMLLRMYTRWADQNNYKVRTITESPGDEAGLKSVTIEIDGETLYGKLKGEHGVHRLVRLSPFNANHLRETSFSKVEIMPKVDRPAELELDDKDLKIDVFRSGGHGGQSVNTTDSAVRITHIPTGISVVIQNERSQLQNREMAMTLLRSKLTQLELEQHKDNLRELKGPNQSAEWGNQIRSYVLHPYKQVKDLRTRYETSDIEGVLDGKIDPLIESFQEYGLRA